MNTIKLTPLNKEVLDRLDNDIRQLQNAARSLLEKKKLYLQGILDFNVAGHTNWTPTEDNASLISTPEADPNEDPTSSAVPANPSSAGAEL